MNLESTKRRLCAAMLGVGLSVSAAAAWAGFSENKVVTINTVTKVAEGAIQAARSSADAVQYIKCLATGSSISCEAKTSAGTVASCSLSSGDAFFAEMRALVLGVKPNSSVRFVYLANGKCQEISVTNSSTYMKP